MHPCLVENLPCELKTEKNLVYDTIAIFVGAVCMVLWARICDVRIREIVGRLRG